MTGKHRNLRARLACLALLLACAACGHRQPPTVIIITPTGGMEYWDAFVRAARTSAESAGIRTEVAAPQSVASYTEQAQMVDNAIARHVQGILVAPAHQLVLASVLQKAVRDRIPVVIIGNPTALSAKDFSAFLGWDEEEAGRLAARRFVALLGGKGEVGVVGVSPTVEGSSLIEKAFAEEIARSPRIKLVGVKYGLSDWARSRQSALDLVAEHPNIKGIFTTDEFSTHAVGVAFDHERRNRPWLIGVSDESFELNGLRDGHIDALVVSDPRELGTRAMHAMREALAHGDASDSSTRLPVAIVDAKTMDANPIVQSLLRGTH